MNAVDRANRDTSGVFHSNTRLRDNMCHDTYNWRILTGRSVSAAAIARHYSVQCLPWVPIVHYRTCLL